MAEQMAGRPVTAIFQNTVDYGATLQISGYPINATNSRRASICNCEHLRNSREKRNISRLGNRNVLPPG